MTGRSASGVLRLVVLGDSTAFTDHRGPRPPDDVTLYPCVAARHLEGRLDREVALTVLARPGHTVHDTVRSVLKDRHVQFDVLAGADAVVVGVGSFDHAPAGVPPVVDAVVPHLRPDGLRRAARRGLHAAYPRLVRLTGAGRRRTAPREFERLFSLLLDQVRGLTWGRAAGVVLGPTSHRSRYYGGRHPGHAAAEAHQLALARRHGFAAVPVWEHVHPHLSDLNPDGIHWPSAAHAAVGRAAARALVPMLTGAAGLPGLPGGPEAGRREAPGAAQGGGPGEAVRSSSSASP